MASSSLIPGLPAEIVEEHILPKIMRPMLEYYDRGDELRRCEVRARFFTLLCIYKYMGVNKAWRKYFGMREVYNALRMSMWDVDICVGHQFKCLRGTLELHEVLMAFNHNIYIFSHTQPIAIPIHWEVQHARLNDLWIMDLEYLRGKLVENRKHWIRVDGRSCEHRRCVNYWICPSERLLT